MSRSVRARTAPVLLVALGGALGATLRGLLGAAAGGALLTTLAVNVAGSLALGVILFDARAAARLPRRVRYLLGTGFLSSFTTYSTFVVDAALATPAVAVTYVVASYAGGFGGVLAGRALVATASGRPIRSPGDRP